MGGQRTSWSRYAGPPISLANMRLNGVRSLYVWCLDCGHDATLNVDDQPGHVAVPSFAARMKCSKCGGRSVSVRPAWKKKPLNVARD
jgi:hypothetical protein